MFCSNCGKPDQAVNSYCRACGEFINQSSGTSLRFGGSTPGQNVNSILVLGAIGTLLSLLAAVAMYWTNFSVPAVLFFAAAVLICNAGWHLSNLYVGVKLKKRLSGSRDNSVDVPNTGNPAVTRDLLTHPVPETFTPDSVTDETTRQLTKTRR